MRSSALPLSFGLGGAKPAGKPVTSPLASLKLNSASNRPVRPEDLTSDASLTDPSETSTLLFLGGCALALLAGCGLRVERFVAYWDSFENFVRAVMS
jgi:hypothetical protein